MFIVENGKITNDKTFDIGESRVTNFVFKFDIAFDDADKFELDLSGNKFNLYGFTDAGCLRFSYVDVSEIIKKASKSSWSLSFTVIIAFPFCPAIIRRGGAVPLDPLRGFGLCRNKTIVRRVDSKAFRGRLLRFRDG